jgi:hypothetical protein
MKNRIIINIIRECLFLQVVNKLNIKFVDLPIQETKFYRLKIIEDLVLTKLNKITQE